MESTGRLGAKTLDEDGDDHPSAYREAINANAALLQDSGLLLLSAKSIIPAEQSRENAAYGTLATPDEVEIVLPEDALVAVAYQATWNASAGVASAHASIFLGANQVTISENETGEPVPVETEPLSDGATFQSLFTCSQGLATTNKAAEYKGDVTTGQIVGGVAPSSAAIPGRAGGPMYIFAAAGTYKISVKFKASSGKVTVKNRKLWAWVVA
jgi:hypothetical protein